jgi:hypothetical protein
MPEIIAAVEVPNTVAANDATMLLREKIGPLLFEHSCRVFLFASLHARAADLRPDPELLYLAALFHDAGLLAEPSEVPRRFEVDGADLAREFMRERGFSATAVDVVWAAIALHTTPGIPGRLGPEIAAMNLGVLTDAIGEGLDRLDPVAVREIIAAHPRGDFKRGFLEKFREGLMHRPDTTYGTVNADIVDYFEPGSRRGNMVDRILSAGWES